MIATPEPDYIREARSAIEYRTGEGRCAILRYTVDAAGMTPDGPTPDAANQVERHGSALLRNFGGSWALMKRVTDLTEGTITQEWRSLYVPRDPTPWERFVRWLRFLRWLFGKGRYSDPRR